MTESIETFVSRLHEEGIQAGQADAEKIREQARREAGSIVNDARQEAQRILTQAQSEAKSTLEKGRTELQLAARDAILILRNKIKQILQTVLAGSVKPRLDDPNFLTPLLRDIILQYAHADCEKNRVIKINVSPEQHRKLADWAIDEINHAAQQKGMSIDLKGTLKQTGFEYQMEGATVEVTVESVMEMLMKWIGPGLNQLLDQVVKNIDR
jgi:V/A-type H+/Na+-transporting ATPase subunit E